MDFNATNVERVIVAIFSGDNRAEYNQYLVEFAETRIAWEVTIQLFSSEYGFVQYFAANILYSKV